MPPSQLPDPNSGSRFSRLFKNWLGLAGGVVIVSSIFSFLLLFSFSLFASKENTYVGILTFVVSPAFFLLGWVIVFVGAILEKRVQRLLGQGRSPHRLVIDVTQPSDRRRLTVFALVAMGFFLVSAFGSYQTYHYTESIQFCGQSCHKPMGPEFTAYNDSPHARVACTECHIGAGATGYVKAKLNGVHQLYCTLSGNMRQPIPTPVKNIPLTQETCEQCHWPRRTVGIIDHSYTHFLADETNTSFTVRLALNVGGGDPAARDVSGGGIHWHMNLANKVEYLASDEGRQVIPWVRFTDAKGNVTEYRAPKFTNQVTQAESRRMSCMDCHNRPAHIFRSPNDAVDIAFSSRRFDPSTPWLKSNLVAVLVRDYKSVPEAHAGIADGLRKAYPKAPKLDSMITEAQSIYSRNFFPDMKTDWRTHPNNLGHKEWPGCFRCHDGLHKSSDGKKTLGASNCNGCHVILAQGSGPDLEKMNPKGYNFFHLDADYTDFSCNNCHTGAFPK